MRSTLKIGAVVLVAAFLVTTGIALALVDDDVTTDTPAAEEAPAVAGRIMDVLAPLVADGTITEAQAEAVADALAETLADHPRRGGSGRLLDGVEDLAEFIGITSDGLGEALRDGATLAEIAEDNGSSAEAVIGYLVERAEARLAEAVEGGRLTEDEAAGHLAEITERITDMVNGESDGPLFGGGRRGHHMRGGRGFEFGPGGGFGFDAPGA